MDEFKKSGKTMFFVSHSIGQMKKFCQKGIWLEHGQLKMEGKIDEVIPAYEEFLAKYKKMSDKEKREFREQGFKKQSDPEYIGKI